MEGRRRSPSIRQRGSLMFPSFIDFILILVAICLALWLVGQGLSFI